MARKGQAQGIQIMLLAVAACVLTVAPAASAASADTSGSQVSRLSFSFGGGLAAAGDLFSVDVPQTVTWMGPVGDPFNARRYTVTLDEDALIDVGISLALTETLGLRLRYRWAEMDATALANDSQIVTPVRWDQLSFQGYGVDLHWDLARAPITPFLMVGAEYRAIDAAADALDQEAMVPVFGAGIHYRMASNMRLRLDITDTIQQIESKELVDDFDYENVEFTENGPQHWIGVSVTMELGF